MVYENIVHRHYFITMQHEKLKISVFASCLTIPFSVPFNSSQFTIPHSSVQKSRMEQIKIYKYLSGISITQETVCFHMMEYSKINA